MTASRGFRPALSTDALDIGTGSYKAASTGDFGGAATDIAEFSGQHVGPVASPGGPVVTDSYHFLFTVGKGAFVLIAR